MMKRIRLSIVCVLLILMLGVTYVASTGPMHYLFCRGLVSAGTYKFLNFGLYDPVFNWATSPNPSAARRLYRRYISWWQRLAE